MPGAARFVAQRFDVRVQFLAVFVAHIFRSDFHALLGFQIDQRGGLAEFGPNFLGIENMKQNDFISVEAQRLDGPDNVLGRIVKVGDEYHDSAAPQELLKMVERLGEVGAGARLGMFEAAQQADELSLPRRRPNVTREFHRRKRSGPRRRADSGSRDKTARRP